MGWVVRMVDPDNGTGSSSQCKRTQAHRTHNPQGDGETLEKSSIQHILASSLTSCVTGHLNDGGHSAGCRAAPSGMLELMSRFRGLQANYVRARAFCWRQTHPNRRVCLRHAAHVPPLATSKLLYSDISVPKDALRIQQCPHRRAKRRAPSWEDVCGRMRNSLPIVSNFSSLLT